MEEFTSNALLTSRAAAKAGVTQVVSRKVLKALIQVIYEELATGSTVYVKGLGKISMASVAPRKGRNPATGESVDIAGTARPRIRWSKMVKESVDLHSKHVKGVIA